MNISTVEAAVHTKEMRRWIAWLGGAMIGSAIFTAAALAGGGAWLILPAILVGPGVGGIALVWLAISSDTNRISHAPAVEIDEVPAVQAA